jgi:hypothetical protein
LPRDKLVVITGLSGSGKSTLAFDTLYAEGQRRYVESLSTYARQFLERMEKPDVDMIEGLSPAIAIEQNTAGHNPRSTVGTVTEVYDYLRLLYARSGTPHCYQCGQEIRSQTLDQTVDHVMSLKDNTPVIILSPLISDQKGTHENLLKRLGRWLISKMSPNWKKIRGIPWMLLWIVSSSRIRSEIVWRIHSNWQWRNLMDWFASRSRDMAASCLMKRLLAANAGSVIPNLAPQVFHLIHPGAPARIVTDWDQRPNLIRR